MAVSCFLVALKVFRRVAGSIALLVTLSALTLTGYGQTGQFERSIPVANKAKITILNAPKISISSWDKNEVAILARAAAGQVTDEEIKIQSSKGKLEIQCHTHAEKPIHITLRVPSTSVLELKTYDYKVEIKKLAGVININSSRRVIHLDVPESAELDLKGVIAVTRVLQHSGGFGVATRPGGAHFGGGPPLVKVSANGAEVLVSNGPIKDFTGSATLAAKTIAGKDSLLGRALRGSHPELTDQASQKSAGSAENLNPVNEADVENYKLQTYLVNLNISVSDRDGKAISGLNRSDFSVYEEDNLQSISFFSSEQAPFNLILLIDLSGSVRDKLDLIKEAALHFLDVIGPKDKVAVITFTTDINFVSHLTNDRKKLRESIRNLRAPVGGTAFYDALGYALAEELNKVKGQRNAVIAITDGQDNALFPSRPLTIQRRLAAMGLNWVRRTGSFLTFEQLLDGVLEADALVYSIHLSHKNALMGISANTPQIGGRPANQVATDIAETSRKQLQELASASGARLFSAARIEDLKDVYDQVAADLRTVYSIGYNPKSLNFDGKFRRIRVKVSRPEASVRTRRGYYAQQ